MKKIICNKCGHEVEREEVLDYPYYCPFCDENKYGIETTEKEVAHNPAPRKERKNKKDKTLTVKFTKTRTAEKIVEDLKFALEWDGAEYYLSKGQPCVRYWFTDEDGKTIQRTRTLLDLDAICEECSDGTCADDASFKERFDYVFYVWGKDESGNWVMGYED